MNTATFCGRLGRDAEMKYTTSGKAVTNFSIAVDIGYGDQKKTMWVQGTLWEKRAESLTQYLTKGKQIVITGPVETRAWISKQDSEAQSQITMNVRELTLCGGGADRNESQAAPAERPQAAQPISDEDIPF